MNPVVFTRAPDAESAFALAAAGGRFIAGGTTLVDLMREGVETPGALVDINGLPLAEIRVHADRLELGSLARMSDVARHPEVGRLYPAIAQSLLQSASPQLRNMATLGGNLLQRTRCPYFRDVTAPCSKRSPGAGCAARHGDNRMHAILGGSESCVATNASDLAVALVALDASVRLASPLGERSVRLEDFYVVPNTTPQIENELRPAELITAIDVPAGPHAARSVYLKVRDRASFEFALVSAAVGLVTDGDRVREVRIAAGGVGTRPWRMRAVEETLVGSLADRDHFAAAAQLALAGATPLAHNAFKLELLPRVIARALELAEALP